MSGIVFSVLLVADAFAPPLPPKEVLTERLEAKQAREREVTGEDHPDWDEATRAIFQEGFDKLNEYLKQQQLESLAREDALRAQLEELKVTVKSLRGDS